MATTRRVTRVVRKQEGLLELASREAHERQAVYFATILNDDGSPYCAMESNVGYFGLDFLGNKYEDYLLYEYREDEHSEKLFLKSHYFIRMLPWDDGEEDTYRLQIY